jgi:hypothetical protein
MADNTGAWMGAAWMASGWMGAGVSTTVAAETGTVEIGAVRLAGDTAPILAQTADVLFAAQAAAAMPASLQRHHSVTGNAQATAAPTARAARFVSASLPAAAGLTVARRINNRVAPPVLATSAAYLTQVRTTGRATLTAAGSAGFLTTSASQSVEVAALTAAVTGSAIQASRAARLAATAVLAGASASMIRALRLPVAPPPQAAVAVVTAAPRESGRAAVASGISAGSALLDSAATMALMISAARAELAPIELPSDQAGSLLVSGTAAVASASQAATAASTAATAGANHATMARQDATSSAQHAVAAAFSASLGSEIPAVVMVSANAATALAGRHDSPDNSIVLPVTAAAQSAAISAARAIAAAAAAGTMQILPSHNASRALSATAEADLLAVSLSDIGETEIVAQIVATLEPVGLAVSVGDAALTFAIVTDSVHASHAGFSRVLTAGARAQLQREAEPSWLGTHLQASWHDRRFLQASSNEQVLVR